MDVSNIKVSISGTDNTSGAFAAASNNVKQLEKQTTLSANLIAQGLSKIGPALAAGFSAREILSASDALTRVQGRLKNVTDSQVGYNQSLQDVQRIAASAQAPIEGVTTLYARSYRALESLGASQKQVALLSENVALALKAEGAAATESESVMIQLSQALASGALRGDEFNSIAENAPLLQKALADSLGITTGELRSMAENGELTSKVLLNAFGNDKLNAELRAQAANMQTASGAQADLSNNFGIFVGLLGQKAGIVDAYTSGLGAMSLALREVNQLMKEGHIGLETYLPAYQKFRETLDQQSRQIWTPSKKAGSIISQTEFDQMALGNYGKSTITLANPKDSVEFQKEIDQLQQIVDLTKEGISAENARTMVKLQDKGATDSQIKSYIALNDVLAKAAKAKNPEAVAKEIAQYQQINALIQNGVAVEEARTMARLKGQGATEKQISQYLSYQAAISQAANAEKDLADAKKLAQQVSDQVIASNQQYIAGIYDAITSTQAELDNYGKLPSEITKATIARLEEVKAISYSIGLGDQNVENINREIEARKQLLILQTGIDGKKSADEAKKRLQDQAKEAERLAERAADEARRQFERTSDIISRSLTDALMRGFENGKSMAENFKDALKNMFRTLVLEPVIRYGLNASGITGFASGVNTLFSGTANAAGMGGVGFTSNGSILDQGMTIVKGITNGFDTLNTGISSSIEKLGVFLSTGEGGLGDQLGGFLGQYSSQISNVLGYAGAAYAGINYLKDGNYAGAALTAAGAYFGGPAGAAIGSLVGGLFGKKKSTPRYSAGVQTSYYDGEFTSTNLSGIAGFKKDLGGHDSLATVAKTYSETIDTLLKAFDINATINTNLSLFKRKGAWGYWGGSVNGISAGQVYAYSSDTQDAFNQLVEKFLSTGIVNAVQVSGLPDGIKQLFSGLTDQTTVRAMVQSALTIANAQDALMSRYGLTVDAAGKVATASSLAGEELANFAAKIAQTALATQKSSITMLTERDKLKELLGGDLPISVSAFDARLKGIDTSTLQGQVDFATLFAQRDRFAQFTTSWDAVANNLNSSLYGMLSPSEQLLRDTQALNAMYEELGITVPNTTADLMKLGEDALAAIKAGNPTEQLYDLALAFPTLVEAFKKTQEGIIATNQLSSDYFSTRADFLSSQDATAAGDSPLQFIKSQAQMNAELAAQLKEMQQSNADMKAYLVTLSENTAKFERTLDEWDKNGMPATREETA